MVSKRYKPARKHYWFSSEMTYQYLFPYEKIPPKSKILIYGAGTLGQEYYMQLSITEGYCEVIGFVDKNYKNYANCLIPVYAPSELSHLQFDYVVVALRMAAGFNEIRRILLESNIPERKIIAVFERNYEKTAIFGERDYFNIDFAFLKGSTSIGLLTTGGFGDMVIQKRLIMEIISLVPDCYIDIYNIKAIELLKHLYTVVPNVKNVIPDLGNRYSGNCGKYKLGLTIEACHFIKADVFDENFWDRENRVFSEKMKLLIHRTKEENAGIATPAHVTIYRRLFKGYHAYTGFNYDGVFDIADKKVEIPLDPVAENRFQSLELGDYVTVNCGNGDCADGTMVAKSWPIEYYPTLLAFIKTDFPSIKVIQLGGENSYKIKNADIYILGEEFTFVEQILKHSMLHIDIEGGLVHIASQLGTKCVVLFGPTVLEYYGYDHNINIRAGECHNCWGLYTDVNKCARGMDQPVCMYSITPEIVYEQVKKVLENER